MAKVNEVFVNEDSMYSNQWLVKFDDGVEATTGYDFIDIHRDNKIIEHYHKCCPDGEYGQIIHEYMSSQDQNLRPMTEKHVKRWLELQPKRRVTSETHQGYFVLTGGKMVLERW